MTAQVLGRHKKQKKSGMVVDIPEDDNNRTHSVGLGDTGKKMGPTEMRIRFVELAHQSNVMAARINRVTGLVALLLLEDLPMLILNLVIVSDYMSQLDDNTTSRASPTSLLLSMTIGNMMASQAPS